MGTNHYLAVYNPITGSHQRIMHLGKSSGGWVYAVHVYPEKDINNLDDLVTALQCVLKLPNIQIISEYKEPMTLTRWLKIVKERSWPNNPGKDSRWYTLNHAVEGPNYLARSKVDGTRCISHGTGTWDHHVGEFC